MRMNNERNVFGRIEAKMRRLKWMLAVTIVLLLAILVMLPWGAWGRLIDH
jgi:hypothetical protein